MAPEQRERPAAVDHRADIYALGVVLYQLLTGELPDSKQLQPPSQRVQLDIRLDAIVLRALEANPSLRYAAASELKTQLETVAASSHPAFSPATGSPTPPSALAASSSVPTASVSTPSAPPPFRVSAIFSRPRLKFWLLRVAPLTLLITLALRFFVIAPYRIDTSSIEPEIPAGSLAFVYKLGRHFSPGDIIAYRHSESLVYVGRVDTAHPVDGKIFIARKNQGVTGISPNAVVGKVVFNTRSNQGRLGAPESRNSATLAINAVILLSLAALLIWMWKILQRPFAAGASKPPLALPAGAFVLLCTLHLAWISSTADELPVRVASHFGMDGRADGFMSKNGYLLFICAFPLGLGLFLQATTRLALRLPSRFVNIPHREIWLAPARRAELTAILQSWFAALSCGLVIFSAQLHTLTLLANRLHPPRLPDIALFTLIGFPFILLLWSIGLLLRLAEPNATPRNHTRRSLTLAIVSIALLGFFAAPAIVAWHHRDENGTSSKPTPRPASSIVPSELTTTNTPDKPDDSLAPAKPTPTTEQPLLRIQVPANTEYPKVIALLDAVRKADFNRIRFDTFHATQSEPLTAHDTLPTETKQEVLRLKLAEAKNQVATAKNRVEAGLTTREELHAAQDAVAILEAEHRGDTLEVARIKVAAAERRFADLNERHKNGLVTSEELSSAKTDLAIRQLELAALFKAGGIPAPDSLIVGHAGTWLRQIDDGHYAQSWQTASATFRQSVTEAGWSSTLTSVRAPLGQPLERRLIVSERFEKLPNTPGGPHLILKFSTRFEHAGLSTETVSFTRDTDGIWRASGYLIKPETTPAPPEVIQHVEPWLRLGDDGRYAENWAATSPLLKKTVTEPQWAATLQSVRAPLGAVLERKLITSRQFENFPGLARGPHIVFQFSTHFENKPDAVETVTFTRDPDGIWRASGYFIK